METKMVKVNSTCAVSLRSEVIGGPIGRKGGDTWVRTCDFSEVLSTNVCNRLPSPVCSFVFLFHKNRLYWHQVNTSKEMLKNL